MRMIEAAAARLDQSVEMASNLGITLPSAGLLSENQIRNTIWRCILCKQDAPSTQHSLGQASGGSFLASVLRNQHKRVRIGDGHLLAAALHDAFVLPGAHQPADRV
jgi:hypothetical protein